MKVQVNSDKSIAVHAKLATFVEGEVSRILRRFAARLTRVEVHLSDVDSTKSGPADKRCLIEVRPAGGPPRSASARASTVAAAVDQAARKMKRVLTAYYGRMELSAAIASTPAHAAKKLRRKKTPPRKLMSPQAAGIKPARSPRKRAAKKPAVPELIVEHFTVPVAEPQSHDRHSPKTKRIYQGRREAWPAR